MAKPNKRIKIRRENTYGFSTISLAMYFFTFRARYETMKGVKQRLTWKQFDTLFLIYLFEKTGELATYTKLHNAFSIRFTEGINFRTVSGYARQLRDKGFVQMIDRRESSATGGRRIESQLVTTVKGKAVITRFLRICLKFSDVLPDFSVLED